MSVLDVKVHIAGCNSESSEKKKEMTLRSFQIVPLR